MIQRGKGQAGKHLIGDVRVFLDVDWFGQYTHDGYSEWDGQAPSAIHKRERDAEGSRHF